MVTFASARLSVWLAMLPEIMALVVAVAAVVVAVAAVWAWGAEQPLMTTCAYDLRPERITTKDSAN